MNGYEKILKNQTPRPDGQGAEYLLLLLRMAFVVQGTVLAAVAAGRLSCFFILAQFPDDQRNRDQQHQHHNDRADICL